MKKLIKRIDWDMVHAYILAGLYLGSMLIVLLLLLLNAIYGG